MRLLAMDSASMNPYEQQLYTVFKTFDVDNEEALNKSAVLDLCDALQLEDRGAALVGSLFERSSDRVTFTQFRNGLLSVLSGDSAAATAEPLAPAATAPAAHSDEDSSGREVAPKFVFGSKKYGRRSRPQRPSDGHAPRAASVSRLDVADERARSSQRMRCRRSASAMETRELDSNTDDDVATDNFDHDRRIDRDQALALCRDLRMDGIDRRLVDRIFEDSRADDTTTVGEFFDRLNASLTSSIEGACEAGGGPDPVGADPEDDDAGVASELVVDAWERAGVPRPRRLLLELGFGAAAVRPPDLERALDDELAALEEPLDERRDTRALVLLAALALARLRLRRARRRADLAAAERDKLRADVAEANRRARLLAQDVDETHARMESVILVGAEGRRDAAAGPDEAAAREAGAQTDAADPAPATDADLKSVVHELKKDLADAESRQESEKLKLTDLVRELEASLEAMREEYERCEEYWAGKLADERAAHERELRGGDERLAELVARVADYERHFAPQLPPIEERAALEAQVTTGPAQT
ncbi:hypothetical protein ABMA27_001783 [Loxostege sticticalis]|uniref:Blastoderm-specific protein 25D n=1 Tax=Loxostege sticticalis TaxID=481309 RepID=A0ABR3HVF7_LOXSC